MKNLIILIFALIVVTCTQDNSGTEASNEGDSVNSLERLNDQIIEDPNNSNLYLERAKILAESKDIEGAENDILRSLALDSTNVVAYLFSAQLNMAQRRMAKVKDALDKAVEIEPDNTDVLLDLAEYFLVFTNYPKSMEMVNKALRLNEQLPRGYYLKGHIYRETGDTSKTISSFQTATELDPMYYDAFIMLGLIYTELKNDLAKDYYTSALEIRPDSREALYNLAMYYQLNEKYDEALDSYSYMMEIDSTFELPYFNSGYIYLSYLEDYSRAKEYFTSAIKIKGNYPEAYYNRGLSQERMGYLKDALIDYKVAVQLNNDYDLALQGITRVEKYLK